MKRILLFLTVAALLATINICKVSAQTTVGQWDTLEVTMTSAGSYSNPYTDVIVTATFNGPGGRQKTVKGFWDGGDTFKVRFTPTVPGTWTYSISSSPGDSGLTQSDSIDVTGPATSDHGFVRIDPSYPSSFIFDDDSRYFMFGTTAYSIMGNAMAGNNWQSTINHLQAHGINKVRILLYPWDGSKYPDSQPFTGGSSTPNHDSLRIEHWQKFDEIIEYMADRDVVADIILFPDSDRGHGTQTQDERYTRYAVARFAAYPNVIWCMRNEWNLDPVFPMSYWNNLGGIVRNEDPWVSEGGSLRPLSIHRGNNKVFDFHDSSWHSHIIIQYGIWSGTNPTYPDGWGNIGIVENLGYNMPVVNDEYGYTGMKVYCEGGYPIFDRTRNRQAMWGIYIAGGYASMGDGYDIYGNDANVYTSWSGVNFITGDYYDCPQYDDAKRLIDFWTTRGIEYWDMSSRNDLIASGSRVYVLADLGKEYVVYSALGSSFTVNLEAGEYNYEWFNPSTGGVDPDTGIITASGGSESFSPPFSGDAVLYLVGSSEPLDPNTIPQGSWTLHYVDSEELVGEDGAATNAFDGSSSTLWHTPWYGDPDPPHPHEIQIDLGDRYEIYGFHYLPRSDGYDNGRIDEYEFYVSEDGSSWGSPVSQGNLANSASEQEILFQSVDGRFVRLRALSEVNGNEWTSVAEINVLGDLSSSCTEDWLCTPWSCSPCIDGQQDCTTTCTDQESCGTENDKPPETETRACGTAGLVGYWTFDVQDISGGTVVDVSGSGNDVTMHGNPQNVPGRVGEALVFDGQDDYLQVSDSQTLDIGTQDFTVAMWINRTATGTREDLVTKKDVNTLSSQHDISILIDSGDRLELFMRETEIYDIAMSSGTIGTGWAHITVTRSGTNLALYINGEQDGSGTSSCDISSNGPLRIASNRLDNSDESGVPTYPFSGIIDDVRIYNTSLSSEQITGLYNQPVHSADTESPFGCIEMAELTSFIDSWKYDSTTYPMWKMMEAVVLYYSPGTWC